MSKSHEKEISYSEKLASLLPLGYLYLIVLGILNQSIQYGLIGINILNYVAISDVLFSPITILTSHYIVLISVVVIGIGLYYLVVVFFSRIDIRNG